MYDTLKTEIKRCKHEASCAGAECAPSVCQSLPYFFHLLSLPPLPSDTDNDKEEGEEEEEKGEEEEEEEERVGGRETVVV